MNAKQINEYFDKLLKETTQLTKAEMNDFGEYAKELILDRTAHGLDDKRSIFKKYSSAYAQERLKSGLSAFPVNLKITGETLNQTYVEVSKNKITIGNNSPIAAYLNGGTSKMPQREFLGINNGPDIEKLEKKLQLIIDTKGNRRR